MINDVFAAAQTGNAPQLMRLLSSNPALANMENAEGLTPLGFAAHFGHAQAAAVLLDYGAVINALSHSKVGYIPSNTALHAAIAGERSMEVIGLLLERGAATNIFDSNGHTCLHVAAFHDDNWEMANLLIEFGADVHAKREGGASALSIAIERGNLKVAELLREKGAVE
ncbi:ankyrin repeat domain-containing protein [Cohnella faecalis]|uniref:Ankyrin repeat domain-containing protein n=1 Tax=Cohnella faecalis TaxID=2315694 RepID=A0A398CAR3_9BACL|nr:ankyrin repeat domain-containing protein [Cohnella faecalis]RIE00226.1 ankyrin repeat domain-containing protein [Cohnella faecalis]